MVRDIGSFEKPRVREIGIPLYILRICKKFGYSQENLHYLFNTLIMSLFKYALPVWGCANYSTYLVNIDKLQNRAVKFGYLKHTVPIYDLIESSDNTIWNNIKNNPRHPLAHLLPPQRTRILRSRSHNFILPKIKTERLKMCF